MNFKHDPISVDYQSQCFRKNDQLWSDATIDISANACATSPQPWLTFALALSFFPEEEPQMKEGIAMAFSREASSFHPTQDCWEEKGVWLCLRLQVRTQWLSSVR